jgi:hypothetical protein
VVAIFEECDGVFRDFLQRLQRPPADETFCQNLRLILRDGHSKQGENPELAETSLRRRQGSHFRLSRMTFPKRCQNMLGGTP